jgi:hypothetical protein
MSRSVDDAGDDGHPQRHHHAGDDARRQTFGTLHQLALDVAGGQAQPAAVGHRLGHGGKRGTKLR